MIQTISLHIAGTPHSSLPFMYVTNSVLVLELAMDDVLQTTFFESPRRP